MADVEFDLSTFEKRIQKLIKALKSAEGDYDALRGLAAIVIAVGPIPAEALPNKSTAIQTWLLAHELPNTIMGVTKSGKVFFLAHEVKANLLRQLQSISDLDVEVITKPKDKDVAGCAQAFGRLTKLIQEHGSKVGVTKDIYESSFINGWKDATSKIANWQTLDVSASLAEVMARKDTDELNNHRVASGLTDHLAKYFQEKVSSVLTSGKKMSHEQIANLLEAKMARKSEDDPDLKDVAFWQTCRQFNGIDQSNVDTAYSPIIQSPSSNEYSIKSSAVSDNKTLKRGVILGSVGVRYKAYNANIARTLLYGPTREQSENYEILLELQSHLLSVLKAGTSAANVYEAAVGFLTKTKRELVAHLPKNLGFATGVEFREASFLIASKTTRQFHENMVVILTLGLQNLGDSRPYALLLSDTLLVGKDGSELITHLPRDLTYATQNEKEVSTTSRDRPAEKSSSRRAQDSRQMSRSVSPQGGPRQLRGRARVVTENTAQKIAQHQNELHAGRQKAGLEKYGDQDGEGSQGEERRVFQKYESYKREAQMPNELSDLRIFVDARNSTVILPIYGQAVAFHINSIKNITKAEEGDYATMRFNFIAPGQIVGRKEDVVFEDPEATFIRSITFKSLDFFKFTDLTKEINDLKKAAVKKVADQKNMADVIEQEALEEQKQKRVHRLQDIMLRNAGLEGKKGLGTLEIHVNGLRYQGNRADQRIDLAFSNMKHLFFQPCDHELVVILHIHLKQPIMIGRKKTLDVQVYREVSDASFDETGNRRRRAKYGDEDEIEAEEDERRARVQLNREFKAFADKISQASDNQIEVDIPFRELGFTGVQGTTKSNVLLQPTTDCLVHLTEFPPTVVTLSEVEVAHLERVSHGLKNFDLVFVFSDFKKAPAHYNTIPMKQLDNVKEWLDSVDIPLSEGPMNLNWPQIMKVINEDPGAFFDDGGWGFLRGEVKGDDSSESSDSGSAFSDAPESSSEDEESESDFEDDESESDASASASDSGEDWDDMEEKAAKDDAKKVKSRDR